jgi:hypothetical protein
MEPYMRWHCSGQGDIFIGRDQKPEAEILNGKEYVVLSFFTGRINADEIKLKPREFELTCKNLLERKYITRASVRGEPVRTITEEGRRALHATREWVSEQTGVPSVFMYS